MKILLTGGLGGIGRPLARSLIAAGHEVRITDRAPQVNFSRAEYYPCDVTDYAAVRAIMQGMEAVVHLAAIISPGRGQAHDVFHTNATGTFNVYQAAVEAGVRKLVNFSSINTLGYNFSIRPVPLHYFPLDESHPSFTTDPYSFSKQICEQVSEYFWRRDGFSSLSLRPTGVYNLDEFPPDQMREFVAGFNRVLVRLLERPEAERLAVTRRALELFDATRPERAVPGAPDSWTQRGLRLVQVSPDAAAVGFVYGGHNDFWTSIDVRDVCQAVEKALAAEIQGHHALLLTDSHNMVGIESERLLRLFFPQVTHRTRSLVGTESIVSIDRARTMLGFEPEFSIQRFYP
jgi:nucleoside-diphosphate-sugar epimerase